MGPPEYQEWVVRKQRRPILPQIERLRARDAPTDTRGLDGR